MRLTSRALTLIALTAPLLACGGGQRALSERADEAARERDALRVAYEAQQLKLKELSERLLALEDRLTLEGGVRTASARPLPSGGGLWGRPVARDLSALPVVRLSRAQQPPSAQRLRDERLALEGAQGRQAEDGVPTLTADNVARFRRERTASSLSTQASLSTQEQVGEQAEIQRRRKRKRRPYAPPQGAEEAASLGVVPLPKRPSAPPSLAPINAERDERDERDEHLTPPLPPQELYQEPSQAPPQAPPQEPSLAALQQAERHSRAARWAEAREAYELVISLAPSAERRAEGRLGLALSLKALNQQGAALSTLRALVQGAPTSPLVPDALFEIGALQLSSGDVAQGRATLTRLKSLYPHTSAARRADGLLP